MARRSTRAKRNLQEPEKAEDDFENIEGGGFIVQKKKRKSRSKQKIIESNFEDEDDGDVGTSIKPNKRSTSKKKCPKKVIDSDEESEDEEYVPKESDSEDEEDEPVADNENIVAEINEDAEDEVPLAGRAAPTRRRSRSNTTRKPRKKIDYFKNMTNRLYSNHDGLSTTFQDLKALPSIEPIEAPHPVRMSIQMLPFQLEGLNWLVKQENSNFGGGILADEMGMGKTIQTIGLFMSDSTKRPNLVVVPPVAIVQWKNEIESHTNKALKVYIFHGQSRSNDIEELMEYDVILTTYSVLESVYRKQQYGFKRVSGVVKEKSILHQIQFYRVVLDEAHSIKDRQSGTAKSVNNLKCVKKWCLSGTPLQNRIGELYSLIRFLKVEPFCNYYCTKCPCQSMEWKFVQNRFCEACGHMPMQHTNYFNHFFLKNIIKYGIADAEGNVKDEDIDTENFDPNNAKVDYTDDMNNRGKEAFELLQLLLSKVMLRRTKVQRSDDLGLPPRAVEVRYDTFNPEEKDLYQSLYSDSNRQFNDFVEQGVVLNNYANIFTLITRMRQMADHPDLVLKRMNNSQVNNYEGIVCQLCGDEAEDAIQSKCYHKFCRLCIKEYIDSYDSIDSDKKLECPVCHIGLSIDLESSPLELSEEIEIRRNKKTSIINKINISTGRWKSSTKIEAVIEELYRSRARDHTIKTIVYSQFTSFLDLVDWRLKRAGFKTVRMQGSMSPQQRANTIDHFMNNVNVEVFLVSLKAGGVSLNLTEASQIFIMDPWWHLAAEEQADRVHRIKQTRPVRIVKFCIADSIEKKILELQDKKADMVKATIEGDKGSASRLTPADLQFLFTH